MSTTDKTTSKQRKLDNLKPFKKGESGNPAGRPKGSVSITEAIKNKLSELYIDPKDPEGLKKKKTHLEAIVETVFHNALEQKDPRTLKDIWNYIDGLPKATIEVGGDKESLEAMTDMLREIANSGKK